jgi:N-methylhydantoinase B
MAGHEATAALAPPDALELEIFRYAVESVVEELEINITRTAYSELVYEYKDYCVGLVTRDFRLLSQSRHNLPIFLADLGRPVADAVSVIGPHRIEPGDIFLSNFAAVNGQHLNNVVAATPVYVDDEIAGYVAIRMHWTDVGGSNPTSINWASTSIHQEGVQYRGTKIVDRGDIVPEALATIQANSWMPKVVTGDLMAQIAACKLGVRRWDERVASRWSARGMDALVDAQFAASTKLARSRIAELPDGEYAASVSMDDSGREGTEPLALAISIQVEGERMVVDLSDLPPQVNAPINAGATGGALSAIRVAFKSLLAPERPADEGLFEPLELIIPPGTVLSAEGDAPMGWYNTTLPTMIDLFLQAIGSRCPELVPAGHHGAMWGIVITGQAADGERWVWLSGSNGGFGATAHADGFGPLRTLMHGDNPDVPIEIAEARYPLRLHDHRILRDAGGDGLHRGGAGLERIFELLEPAYVSTFLDRTRNPGWGMAGGEPGRPAEIHMRRPGSTEWEPQGKTQPTLLPAGTLLRLRGGGGGGWGDPRLRAGR